MASTSTVKTEEPNHDLSSELLDRICGFTLDTLPAPVVDQAKLVLADTLGEALASSKLSHAPTRILGAFMAQSAGAGKSSLIGQGRGTTVMDAALFNAALAAFGLNDPLHGATTMHASAVAAAAALAAAEHAEASGRRFLEAFILGTEVACRVSAALDPAAVYGRKFHPTGVCGTFGAAVAAGHALALTPDEMRAALGLALQQACGSLAWTTDNTESTRFLSPGFAARNGASSAVLANLGLGGPPSPFDGKNSVFHSFSGAGHPEYLLAGWGTRFYLMEMTHKLHASCSYTHAALDALLGLVKDHQIDVSKIAEIVMRGPPPIRPYITDPKLRSCHAPYVLAVALTSGRVVIDDVVVDRSREPAIDRLMNAVRVVDDRQLEEGYPDRCAAIVEVRLKNGTVLERGVNYAKGTAANPLTKPEILAKSRQSAALLDPLNAAKLIEHIENIDLLERIDPIVNLIRRVPRNVSKQEN